ncbi:MAG TPA: hypothetical protein VFA67_13520 [Candidatus Sulfotelmatobacter sp.]|nr:hypothetical protein [Candidatus Sulfotelmatobacter sp.]
MRTHAKHDQYSPLDVLTELAVEGTSSLVEAHRTLLDLAKQENEIVLGGVKERVGNFVPAVAMTDMVRRSVDTLIGMQQELLTATSRQTMHWIESEKSGKDDRSARLMEMAREAVETFTRAQQKFLQVVEQEAAKATGGKPQHAEQTATRTELAVLAREAANAFIEAQKKLLDVMSQQMNVNLDLSTKSMEMMSPARLMPTANLTEQGVKNFFKTETELLGSLINPRKPKAVGRAKPGRSRSKPRNPVAV